METKKIIDSSEKNTPEKKFRAGAVSATIWKNETIKDNKVVDYRTISFTRNYQDANGEWNTTSSLRINDLPKARLVIDKAYEYLMLKQENNE
ncbi:hypothetical protein HN789_04625 [archaeon]|jgi:hypothetical protein|nr:hypothetical protein [archaeon]MBT3720146.1 hypothetical protein [archaeon]MBT4022445.1 hypothetical protein [archaeon]MBT4272600.1 hypothetical protein [archaeon]MBT4461234.1 hypothetical protein [archaeon]